MGADTKVSRGGGALERGHGAPLEPLAQLGDALSGVLAVTVTVEATELVTGQAAKGGEREGQCQWALTRIHVWASTGQILGCAAPQVGDLCLFEGGGERGGALGFDRVALETVSKERTVRGW